VKGSYRKVMLIAAGMIALGAWSASRAQSPPSPAKASEGPQIIEVLADHDSRYKIAGEKDPAITVHAGQALTLRITAKKAKTQNRDGSIHGFSLLRAGDRVRVPGWDFLLKPGVQEFNVTAPAEPGDYLVVCTVICSPDHEGMNIRFVVLP
jgi:hypothetical protein